MTTRLILVAFAATASLAVAACGADGKKASSNSPATREAAMRKSLLKFAQCMREHGVDMPDPQFDGGRVQMQMGGKNIDADKARTAQKACQHFQDEVKPPAMSEADKQKFRKQALANARCMREHGINMPDPTFDENGGAQMRLGKGTGIEPNDPAFKRAQKACEKAGGGTGGVFSSKDDQ
jgi:hypothetical protein